MAAYCPYCMSQVLPRQLCLNCGRDPTSYHPSSHHLPLGRPLRDRYFVGKVLGEGGFGITYLGLDTTLERRVAIKEYFPNVFVYRETSVSLSVTCYAGEKQALYEKGRDQFLKEARVMARFDGLTEIVQVLDFFPENNTAYIVMELLSGNTLRTVLAQQGRIPAKYLFAIMEPVLDAMNKMHSLGIIHRDISPDNIMLLGNGQVKLLDFGCARDVDKEHTMTVMLKHGYAPIEQYTGYNQGPWTDVYAVCATLYCCLTGQTPPRALERIAAQDPLISPNRLGAALTPEQEQALMRGLAVEPKNRWQSISGLYAALYRTVIKGFPWLPGDMETELIPEVDSEPKVTPKAETEQIPMSRSELQEERVPHLLTQKEMLSKNITAAMQRDKVTKQNIKLKKDVACIRALQSKTASMVRLAQDSQVHKALEKFSENLRFSDPVSSESLADIEADLVACVDELHQAVTGNDRNNTLALVQKAETILMERNRLCKQDKRFTH